MRHTLGLASLVAAFLAVAGAGAQTGTETNVQPVPENLYTGELVSYPGPYSFLLGKSGIILTSDAELETISADPDAVIDLSLTFDKQSDSLRGICEKAQAAGNRTLLISFDHFFKQYRAGQNAPRRLMPDTDEYIGHIAKVARFAKGYGLKLELGLLSPLEIGPGYHRATGESGTWMHYRKGLRDPKTGAFSVQLWRQLQWENNKGPVTIEDAGVRVFAFRERHAGGTPYLAVDPKEIVEISDGAEVEVWEGTTHGGGFRSQRVRIHGEGHTDIGPLDHVLVVQLYRTPEMDYFSDKALPFLTGLVDRYVDAGVEFNGLYSDEMHIQQDWSYFGHHDNGEFALRYVSDGLARSFAEKYGEEYRDFAKYLVYFCFGQEDTRNDLAAREDLGHVFGPSPEDIRRTSLFRARYFKLLQDGVVDLFVAAKRHLERRMGYSLETRAHATWAESPTIDKWDTGADHAPRNQYDYTSNFEWSCTVHQAASACHDYFKWGEYLTGTGNDHSEGGWLDRDYFGLALACSTGIINEVPLSYAAHWGSPGEIGMRHGWLQQTFGTAGSPWPGMVEGMEHRDVSVLMLYPLDLVSADERFGSWMVQYGYANYITPAELLKLGHVHDGAIELCGRRFTTLVALFEPHPERAIVGMMRDLAAGGGKVVWSGPPPIIDAEGRPLLDEWQETFGASYTPAGNTGWIVPGRRVQFEGPLEGVEPQTILTGLMVDWAYAVSPREGSLVAARLPRMVVGTQKALPSGGNLTYLGFRPRDDQSKSLGYDVRTWFEVLQAVGAYPATGDTQDNTEVLSRTGPHLWCRFPNGALAVAPHLREYEEFWGGGFGRRPEDDAKLMQQNPPPSPVVHLEGVRVNGRSVSYDGQGAMAFRTDPQGNLVAFSGNQCQALTVDGRTWTIGDKRLGTAFWAPIEERRRVPGGAVMAMLFGGEGTVRVPAVGLPEKVAVVAEGRTPGSRGETVPSRVEGGALVLDLTPQSANRLLYVVAGK